MLGKQFKEMIASEVDDDDEVIMFDNFGKARNPRVFPYNFQNEPAFPVKLLHYSVANETLDLGEMLNNSRLKGKKNGNGK